MKGLNDKMRHEAYEVKDFFHTVRKYFWMILVITILITGISAFVTYILLTPIYQAKTQVLVLDTSLESIKDSKNEKSKDDSNEKSKDESDEKSSEQPAKQPAEQPTEQPTEQPAEQPAEQPTEQPTEQPAEQPTEQPAEQLIEQPAEQLIEQPSATPIPIPLATPAVTKLATPVKLETESDKPDIGYDQNLKETYVDLLKSPRILSIANNKLDGEAIATENNVKVESSDKSQIITILAEDPDPDNAVLIANTISETFKEEAHNITKINNVQILMDARADSSPVWPIPLLNIGVSAVLGLILAMFIAFFLELLKGDKIKQRQG